MLPARTLPFSGIHFASCEPRNATIHTDFIYVGLFFSSPTSGLSPWPLPERRTGGLSSRLVSGCGQWSAPVCGASNGQRQWRVHRSSDPRRTSNNVRSTLGRARKTAPNVGGRTSTKGRRVFATVKQLEMAMSWVEQGGWRFDGRTDVFAG